MKRSTKAALISGLVFPGLGHIFLRRYVVGLVLFFLVGWAIYMVANTVIETALDVVGEIERGTIVIDSASISKLVAQRSQQAEKTTNTAMWVLILSWLIGVIDSYRIGRAQERQQESYVEKGT